jgi:hypothetical protein
MSEIRCRELVGAYAVGALEPPEAAVLADHLLTCLRCRHVLAEAEETAALLAAVPPEMFMDEPADANDPLLRRTLHAIRVEAASAPHVAAPPPMQAQHADPRRQAMSTPELRSVPSAGRPAPAAAAAEGGFPGWSGKSATARSHRRRPQASTASQEQRKYKIVGAAAAAVLVLGGGVMLGAKLSGSTEPTSGRTQAASSVQSDRASAPSANTSGVRLFTGDSGVTGVNAKVNLTPITGGGVQLDGTVKGVQANQKCKIAVTDDVGTQTTVESWTTPGTIPATGATFSTVAPGLDASKLVSVEVLDEHNQVMVTAES